MGKELVWVLLEDCDWGGEVSMSFGDLPLGDGALKGVLFEVFVEIVKMLFRAGLWLPCNLPAATQQLFSLLALFQKPPFLLSIEKTNHGPPAASSHLPNKIKVRYLASTVGQP